PHHPRTKAHQRSLSSTLVKLWQLRHSFRTLSLTLWRLCGATSIWPSGLIRKPRNFLSHTLPAALLSGLTFSRSFSSIHPTIFSITRWAACWLPTYVDVTIVGIAAKPQSSTF